MILSVAFLLAFSESPGSPPAWGEPASAQQPVFPVFTRSEELDVVDASGLVYPEQLALVSLQGIVNREQSRIYVDFEGEVLKNESLLIFLSARYNVSLNHITFSDVFDRHVDEVNGIVIYDKDNEHTVNIATMLSGIHDYVIADQDLASQLTASHGLAVGYDLRNLPWSDLRDQVSIYEEALSDIYPSCDKNLIAMLRPEKLMSRDYLIATRSFIFEVPLGPMTTPGNIEFVERVLETTPANIPVLGWFPSPTGAEENFVVQMISESGKTALGGEGFPNLSVLTAYRPRELRQSFVTQERELENKVYVTISVPDGDNIDFMRDKMSEHWNHELRGSLPIAWSMQPLLGELAPVFLEYLYDNATGDDTFIAGPSGAGYLYPDFTPNDEFNLYLWRAKRLMNLTDVDVVWLLNSFTSFETPYSPEKLEAYSEVIEPEAIVLDYGDIASRRSYWIQRTDEGQGVPIVRSTHAWAGIENFLGKVAVDVEMLGKEPHFLFVPINPWTLTLGEIVDAVETLDGWYEKEFEIVSVHEFFDLFRKAVIVNARNEYNEISKTPLAGIFASDLVDSARSELRQVEDLLAQGDYKRATAHASLALEHLEGVEGTLVLTTLISAILILAAAVVIYLMRRGLAKTKRGSLGRTVILLQLLLGVSVFYLTLFQVLYSNFWDYINFVGVVLAVPAALYVRKHVETFSRPSRGVSLAAGVILAVSSGVVLLHGAAIALSAVALILIFSSREDKTSSYGGAHYLLIFVGALLIAQIVQAQMIGLIILSLWLIALSAVLFFLPVADDSAESEESEGVGSGGISSSIATSLLLILLLVPFAFSQTRYFSLAAGFNIPLLEYLTLLALLSSIALAPLIYRAMSERVRALSLLPLIAAYSLTWFVLFLAPSAFFLGVAVVFAQLVASLAFLRAYDMFRRTGGSPTIMASRHVALFVLFGFVVVLPPLSYSLYLFPLPSSIAYFLYSPPLIIATFTALVLLPAVIVPYLRQGRRRTTN